MSRLKPVNLDKGTTHKDSAGHWATISGGGTTQNTVLSVDAVDKSNQAQ